MPEPIDPPRPFKTPLAEAMFGAAPPIWSSELAALAAERTANRFGLARETSEDVEQMIYWHIERAFRLFAEEIRRREP